MFDLNALALAVGAHGKVARVVIARLEGSSPRETGTSMLVWSGEQGGGQSGTIGGGALEWEAQRRALEMLAQDRRLRLDRVALGPTLGQCCGGAVVLLTEVFDGHSLPEPRGGIIARHVGPDFALSGGRMGQRRITERTAEAPDADMSTDPDAPFPLAVRRLSDRARAAGEMPATSLVQGWMVEPVMMPARPLWIWGAGHVGRALVAVIAPLPGFAITWVDVARERFPDLVPDGVTVLPASTPQNLVAHAPGDAAHLIVTYSHALDLELCHRLLNHGFAGAGLIGSATKAARFRSRLGALGHPAQAIARIVCPIGDTGLGKHPQAIAVGVAAALLRVPVEQSGRIAG